MKEHKPLPRRPRATTCCVALVVICVLGCWLLWPRSAVSRIKPGMTEKDLHRILGPEDYQAVPIPSDDWSKRFGYYEYEATVTFDRKGLVSSVSRWPRFRSPGPPIWPWYAGNWGTFGFIEPPELNLTIARVSVAVPDKAAVSSDDEAAGQSLLKE